MAKPTPSEIAEEITMQGRLILAVTDCLTQLSTEDLNHWAFRGAIMQDIEAAIDRIVGASDEKPHLAKLVLCIALWKVVNRLINPIKAAPKRPLSATEALYRERQGNKRGKSIDPSLDTPNTRYYRAKVAKMSPEELVAFKKREADRHRAWRLRKAQVAPGS